MSSRRPTGGSILADLGGMRLIDEAYNQHHTTTYMALLGGMSVAAEWPRPRIRSRV